MSRPGSKVFTHVALPVLLLSFAVQFSVPLSDSDLWWHLATGKYIIHHKALLAADPFTFTSGEISPYRDTILNSYWLAQVIFYLTHVLSGNYGLIALRVVLLLSGLFASLLIARRLGAAQPASIIFFVLAGLTLVYFKGARPQLFSFLLTPVVFFLLDRLKQKYRASEIDITSAVPLALVMCLWANLHGGFLLGSALIVIFTLSEAAGLLARKERPGRQFFLYCAAAFVALACTLINPNTYTMYPMLFSFEGSAIQQRTSEYVSPIVLSFTYGQYRLLLSWWIYLLLSVVVLAACVRKSDKTHLATAVFLGAISLSAARYIPFFVLTTLPIVSLNLARMTAVSRRLLVPAVLSVLLTLFLTAAGFTHSLGMTLKQDSNLSGYPERASSYILGQSPAGNIFNHFNWGGYLIWRLYPRYKVFIDGRSLNMKVFSDYTYMLWDRRAARRLLDRYGIRIVIMPPPNPYTGKGYELLNILNEDRQWRLVFKDTAALVYVRGKENERLKQIDPFSDQSSPASPGIRPRPTPPEPARTGVSITPYYGTITVTYCHIAHLPGMPYPGRTRPLSS